MQMGCLIAIDAGKCCSSRGFLVFGKSLDVENAASGINLHVQRSFNQDVLIRSRKAVKYLFFRVETNIITFVQCC